MILFQKHYICIVFMYTSHYDDFYIFFCKAGCEVNKQADKLGASSPCHLCDKGMSLSTLSSWLNTVITRSSLATMVWDVTNYFIAYYCKSLWIKAK